jgi:hypothetical protein
MVLLGILVLHPGQQPQAKSTGGPKVADQQGVHFLPLPPHSPELNPIEKLWGPLKDHVATCHTSSDLALFAAIQQFWKGLDVLVVNQYVDHLQATVQAIIKAAGQQIFQE